LERFHEVVNNLKKEPQSSENLGRVNETFAGKMTPTIQTPCIVKMKHLQEK